jgi:hypothetical protein
MEVIIKIAAGALPVLGTVALFLALYANSLHGRLILMVLLFANLAVIFFPVRNQKLAAAAFVARLAAMCTLSAVGTVLAMELLFPLVLPAECARIKDLSDRAANVAGKQPTQVSRVFSNKDQRRLDGGIWGNDEKEGATGWHEAGKVFGYYGYDPNEGFSYLNKIHWNSQGFFDHDYALDKPQHVYRIVFIGDSYVEALQVSLAATFHKILEATLNQQAGSKGRSSLKYQVIALGNSGAGQRENLEVLKKLATRYHPDMVVMTLCSNDFCDDDPVLHDERDLYLKEVTPLLRGLLRHHYYVLGFALRRYAEIRGNRISVHPEFLQWSTQELPRIEDAWARTLSLIQASRDYCAARRIDFRLVYLGAELEVKYALDPEGTLRALRNMGAPYRAIAWNLNRSIRRTTRFCQENRIPLISLLDPLVTAQKDTGKRVFGDHYTFFGHQVVAEALNRALNLGAPLRKFGDVFERSNAGWPGRYTSGSGQESPL